MSNPNPDISKLNPPIRSANEARKLGAKGGKKSGEARRKKKLLSDHYLQFIAKKHKIEGEKKSWEDLLMYAFQTDPNKFLRNVAELTEGLKSRYENINKTELTGGITLRIEKGEEDFVP
jgi:hypothetical protein